MIARFRAAKKLPTLELSRTGLCLVENGVEIGEFHFSKSWPYVSISHKLKEKTNIYKIET